MKQAVKTFLSALLLTLVFCEISVAQQNVSLTADGKDFYLSYMAPSYNKVAHAATLGFYGAYVLLTSYQDNVVTLSYFDAQTGLEDVGSSIVIKARQGTSVPLNLAKMIQNDTGDIAQYRACHITAKRPINVQFFSTGACAGGSYLCIPSNALGRRYVAACYNDNNGDGGIYGGFYGASGLEVSEGFFIITATQDNTTVRIIPNSTTKGGHVGVHGGKGASGNEVPYGVTLQRGQCYLVKSSTDDESVDLSGSIIEADKPISVVSGQENANLGGVGNRNLEARDFMIEQMIPVEYWDTTGYIAVPLKDSQPFDPQSDGAGDNYRVYGIDSIPSAVKLYQSNISGPIDMPVGRLSAPTPERIGVVDAGVEFLTTNGHKFNVVQYDQRNQSTGAPFPAPSMLSIIPQSHWRTSFLWYVPNNRFETLQGYYVNIIAPKGDFDTVIKASFNGGPIKPIKQVLTQESSFPIPNHPDLKGVRFKLYPGSYYATGSNPFMIYNYGFRALDPNFDLGDFDNDDYFFGYGLPIGFVTGNGKPHLRITVDTSCSAWNVCVHDSTFGLGGGIKSIVLLDDINGDIVPHPKPNPPFGYKYDNTELDDSLDPTHLGEIVFRGDDTDLCIKVLVQNIFKNGYAPLLITDDKGNGTIVELNYKAPLVSITPDSAAFMNLSLGKDSCTTFVFKNTTPKGGKSVNLLSADLGGGKGFTVSSTVPKLPTSIPPGDSLIVTACFTAKDTNTRVDTLVLKTDCGPSPISLIGSGAIPIIIADDHNFGSIVLNTTKCDTVRVRNVGNAPLLLTKDWLLHNFANFSFPDSTKLPYWLNPGTSVLLTFCYTPHAVQTDTTVQNWGTNEIDPYAHTKKDTSILRGAGIKPGVRWDRSQQLYAVTCDDSETVRMYLFNNFTAPILVTSVDIAGPDRGEFFMVANQLGYPVLTNIQLNPGDSIWVDVMFKPDMTKPVPLRYAPRSAFIEATSKADTVQVVAFTGTVTHADPVLTPSFTEFSFVPLAISQFRSFLLSNNGDGPLTIRSYFPLTYPIINVTGIAPGQVLAPGQSVLITVEAALTGYIDTTVFLNLDFFTTCTNRMIDTVHIAASMVNPQNTGHNYDPTFLNCRSLDTLITGINYGTVDLILKRIDIISTVNTPNPTEFTFTNGTQQLLVGQLVRRGTSISFPVEYHPTIEGPVSATIQFTWDSGGVKTILTQNILAGIGRLEHDTISALSASGGPYNAVTGNFLDVPVNLLRTLPSDVGANGLSFKVTYRRDLLDLVLNSTAYAAGVQPLISPPNVTRDGNGNETIEFVLKSSSPITTLSPILTLHFQCMVAKDLTSDITVSDGAFWGKDPSDILCYVLNQHIPGAFTPTYVCGDSSLHDYLSGDNITKIVSISPNPSVEGSIPIVTYNIVKDKTPLTIELFNALGERVRLIERGVLHDAGTFNLPVATKKLPSGTYIIRFTTGTSIESSVFVIQK